MNNDGALILTLLSLALGGGFLLGVFSGDSAYERRIHELCVKIVPAGSTFEVDKALRECEVVRK
jgi:hypothetical protein